MVVPLTIAALFTAWAMLRIIGGQRRAQIRDMENKLRVETLNAQIAENIAPAPQNPASSPVRSKAGH